MTYKRHSLGLAGLLAAVTLGMMVFASSGQAAVEPSFYVNGSNANLDASLGGEMIAGSSNIILVPPFGTKAQCPTLKVIEGLLENNKKATIKILLEGCKWFELGAPFGEISSCHIISSKTDTKLHITATGTILPTELDDISNAVLMENVVALITNEEGKGCVLPTDNVVTGEICLKIGENHKVKLLLITNATIQKECTLKVLNALGDPAGTKVRDTLKYGSLGVILDTHFSLFLTDAPHIGMTLGVLLP